MVFISSQKFNGSNFQVRDGSLGFGLGLVLVGKQGSCAFKNSMAGRNSASEAFPGMEKQL